MDIPTLDASTFSSGSDAQRAKFAADLVDIFSRQRFVKLVNHGVNDDIIRELFDWNKRFFDIPKASLLKIVNAPGPHPQRGWSCVNAEKTAKLHLKAGDGDSGAEFTDAKQHFDIGPRSDAMFPNQWPGETDLPGFRSFLESYFDLLQEASLQIMQALEIGLQLPPGSFTNMCTQNASELRLNHYPAIEYEKLKQGNTSRIWPHTDFGLITLLFQDDVGGLEIEDPRAPGTFRPVQRVFPNEMIVNIGDCLQRWTNDVLHAGLHRVSCSPNQSVYREGVLAERYSVAFFLKATRETSVGPFPQFVEAERPSKYEDMTALEYQQRRTGIVY